MSCDPGIGPAVGVDLGGTKVLAAVVDRNGRVLSSRRRPTEPDRGREAVIDDIVGCVRELLETDEGDGARAVGVGVAGQVARGSGRVRFAPNLGWREVDLGERLRDALELPVHVANDVRAATFGEWRHGAGAGCTDLACVFVGTGVGGGIVAGDRLLEGTHNTAGEVGHLTVVAGGRDCTCRGRGCLEAYVGGWALAERAREAVRADPAAGRALVERAGGVEEIDGVDVGEAYAAGDVLSRNLVEETGRYLGAGLVSLVNVLGPARIVLGGGVIEGIPDLVELAAGHLRGHAIEAALSGVDIVRAELGDDAGAIGAAALAREAFLSF